VVDTGVNLTNTFTITGGNGGAGGTSGVANRGGSGGAGGAGVTGSSFILINSGTIQGGNGGAIGGPGGGGTAGADGAGVTGSNLQIMNSGTIAGGLAGDGVTRANAINFTGGTNTLELQAGSSITGNVVAFSVADTLRLGGTITPVSTCH
jgi:fibronectin-binding autotransporter adhesin